MTPRTRHVAMLVAAMSLFFAAASHAAPPGNDNFGAAAPLAAGDQLHGETSDATAEPGETGLGSMLEPDCRGIDDGARCTSSVWYTFQPATSGQYTLETCDLSTSVPTVLAVWSGAFDSLTDVADNESGCAGGLGDDGSQVTFAATAGTAYHVEVAGRSAQQGGFYLRAYAGGPVGRPGPDTFLEHLSSVPFALLGGGLSAGGPRQTPSFGFTSEQHGASFQCSLDGAAFAACTSPVSYDGLTGSHTFAVRSVVAGVPDPTPALERFTVDGTPPDTRLVDAPPSPTSEPDLSLTALSSERASLGEFLCGFDANPVNTFCGAFINATVCTGSHSFRIAAVDGANNVDPTPITRSIVETGGAPCAAPVVGRVQTLGDDSTQKEVLADYNPHGQGGSLHVEFGPTTAYGRAIDVPVDPQQQESDFRLKFLAPGTTYHFKVTLTTPSGSDTSGDRTFDTAALNGFTLPEVAIGVPTAAGRYAAAVPLTITAPQSDTNFGVFVSTHPGVSPDTAAAIDGLGELGGAQPQHASVDLLDLRPGTTYYVRGFTERGTLSAEASFTTRGLPLAPLPKPRARPFKLRRGFVKIAAIRRHSKAITLFVRHLPPRTRVSVVVSARLQTAALRRLGTGKARANRFGVARVRVKLSRRARHVLRNRRARSLSLKVSVKPPGGHTSSVTLRRRLAH